MLEKWKHLLDNGYNIGVLFMDLSKGFDIQDHSLLSAKLGKYGFFSKIYNFYSKLLKGFKSICH